MEKANQKTVVEEDLKLIANSSVIVLVGILFSKVFSYTYRIIIARNFGPPGYGLLTLSLMVIGWFIAVSSLGLNQGILRFLPIFRGQQKEEEIKLIFKNSLNKVLISSTIAFLTLFLLAEFIAISIFGEPKLVIFLKFFALAIPLTVLVEVFLSAIQAYEKVFLYNIIYKFFIGLFKLVLLIAFISIGADIDSIYLSNVLAIFFILILTLVLSKRYLPELFKSSKLIKSIRKKKITKELIKYSLPLLFYGVIWKIFYWTDTFLIAYFGETSDVGIYGSVEPIVFLLYIAPQLFSQLFFPLITREYSKGNNEIVKQLTQQVGKWIFTINLYLLSLILIFPSEIIILLFGFDFLAAQTSLRFLAVGVMFYSIFKISDHLMAMKGKSSLLLKNAIIMAILNLILNLFLIPKFGINGAAASTAISLIVLSLILGVQSKKHVSILPIRRKMVNLFLAIIFSAILIMVVGEILLKDSFRLMPFSMLFLVAYLFFILLFKALDKNDLAVLKEFYSKIYSRKSLGSKKIS